ncbi:unnamed protein product, partial [Staurois parvus]
WAQRAYRPGNSAQGWWEPFIVGTAGVQTWELSTGMMETPHNGHSGCTDPGTQHRDGGNPSQWAQQGYRPRNSAQGWWEPLIMGTAGVQTQELSTGMVGTLH